MEREQVTISKKTIDELEANLYDNHIVLVRYDIVGRKVFSLGRGEIEKLVRVFRGWLVDRPETCEENKYYRKRN